MKKAMYVLAVMCLVAGVGSAQRIQSFCEYGTGVALRFGAGGALWDQQWGYAPWDWYDCTARPNVGFLNENVGGLLETTTAGAPVIDADLIVRFSFGGNIVLTAYDECNPDAVAGQIFGDVEGLFVADLNADRAIVDEEAGTITILFGAMLHDEPDALINITKTTGKFKSIKAVGPWQWIVSGKIIAMRIPDLDVQTNILAAVANSDLLLYADEEIVLAGSYYRTAPNK